MRRIFAIIAALSALLVLLAGGGAYWFSAAGAKSAKSAAATSVANGLAVSLSLQLDILQNSVDGLAQSPDVIAALSSGNPEMIKATAAKLQSVIPHNLRLRLLLPSIEDLDQTQSPHLGFGDLEMVRATLTGKPKPVIQGDAEHRHLAITSAVNNDEQVIGVILASIKPNLLQQIVSKTPFDHGRIELRQDQLVLASIGETADHDDAPTEIPVNNSRWQLDVWADIKTSMVDLGILSAIIAIPGLLACLAYFVGYRKLSDFFRQDQSSILKAAKDMLQNKTAGNYPMQLDEMRPIIAALVQFRRVMDQEGAPGSDENEINAYDFFDESFDVDFLDETPPASQPLKTAPIAIPDAPVAMPRMDDRDMKLDEPAPTAVIPDAINQPASFTEKPSSPVGSVFHDFEILGIVGKNLSEELISNIGRAFASEAQQLGIKTLVVARDGRSSSPALSEALIKGIISTGCDVLDLGLVPSPVLQFVSHHSEGRTGMMVTGSHYPADHNGLKLVLQGESLTSEKIRALKNRVDNLDFQRGPSGSVEKNSLFSNEYIGIISEDIHIVRPMTVVVDCGNGATGHMGPMLLKTIGCDVVELYSDIDGQFPNHPPDPCNPDNLEALIKAVKLNNADVGIAFDGDGDRLGVVDSSGRIIWADRQMMLFARDVLAVKPGTEIIYDAACSRHLPEQIKKRGGFPVLCKSGITPLLSRLRQTGASMAGDISGHFLFNDRWFGFNDALYAAVRMIEILSADMRPSSELFDDLPNSIVTPEMRISVAEGENTLFVEQMFSLANFTNGDIVNIEGMRVEFPDGWGLIRAAQSSPDLRMRFEADTPEAMKRIQTEFKQLLVKVKPNLALPF